MEGPFALSHSRVGKKLVNGKVSHGFWTSETEGGGRQGGALESRVQWFWPFLINSLCFMCFWSGREILVEKKAFFWNIEWFDLFSSKKSWKLKVEKNFFKIGRIKRSGILHLFKKCAEVLSLAKGEKNLQKTDLENFAKNRFSEKKSLGTSWRRSSTHFWNQLKIPLLLIPFAPNYEEIFFQLL